MEYAVVARDVNHRPRGFKSYQSHAVCRTRRYTYVYLDLINAAVCAPMRRDATRRAKILPRIPRARNEAQQLQQRDFQHTYFPALSLPFGRIGPTRSRCHCSRDWRISRSARRARISCKWREIVDWRFAVKRTASPNAEQVLFIVRPDRVRYWMVETSEIKIKVFRVLLFVPSEEVAFLEPHLELFSMLIYYIYNSEDLLYLDIYYNFGEFYSRE